MEMTANSTGCAACKQLLLLPAASLAVAIAASQL